MPSQQPFPARRAPVGYFHMSGEFRLASEIPNSKIPLLFRVAPENMADWHAYCTEQEAYPV